MLELAEMNEWQAEIVVQEADIPRVKPGQSVRLYVGAFPHMEYKIFTGKVEEVAVEPAEDGRGYPVKVSISDPEVTDGAQRYILVCGMSAEARIVVERGRIATLVWRKFLRNLGRMNKQKIYLAEKEGRR